MEDGKKHIDDLFRESLGNYRETPGSHVWADLEKRLANKDEGGIVAPVRSYRWMGYGLLLVALVFLGYYAFTRFTATGERGAGGADQNIAQSGHVQQPVANTNEIKEEPAVTGTTEPQASAEQVNENSAQVNPSVDRTVSAGSKNSHTAYTINRGVSTRNNNLHEDAAINEDSIEDIDAPLQEDNTDFTPATPVTSTAERSSGHTSTRMHNNIRVTTTSFDDAPQKQAVASKARTGSRTKAADPYIVADTEPVQVKRHNGIVVRTPVEKVTKPVHRVPPAAIATELVTIPAAKTATAQTITEPKPVDRRANSSQSAGSTPAVAANSKALPNKKEAIAKLNTTQGAIAGNEGVRPAANMAQKAVQVPKPGIHTEVETGITPQEAKEQVPVAAAEGNLPNTTGNAPAVVSKKETPLTSLNTVKGTKVNATPSGIEKQSLQKSSNAPAAGKSATGGMQHEQKQVSGNTGAGTLSVTAPAAMNTTGATSPVVPGAVTVPQSSITANPVNTFKSSVVPQATSQVLVDNNATAAKAETADLSVASKKTTAAATGSGAAANDDTKKPRKGNSFFVGGLKAGYEFNFAYGNANKYVIAPYVQHYFTRDASIVIQPAFKFGKASVGNVTGSSSYYNVVSSSFDSTRTVVPGGVSSSIDSVKYTYTYSQVYDSVLLGYNVTNQELWDIELPVLLKYDLVPTVSFYIGPTLTYSGKLLKVTEDRQTFNGEEKKATFNYGYAYPNAGPVPNGPDRMGYDQVFSYNAQPMSKMGENPYINGPNTMFSVGYMAGFSFAPTKRLMVDVHFQQRFVSNKKVPIQRFKDVYTQPYMRLSLGYRLFGRRSEQ